MEGEMSESGRREEILNKLMKTLEGLHQDIREANPESLEEQSLQLQRHHELGYLANQYRKLQRDLEIDQLDEKLTLLQELASNEGGNDD